MKDLLILNTQFVKILQLTTGKYRVLIAMSDGGWIEHNEFDGDARGLVAAMSLATDCCAGKFYPKRVATGIWETKLLDHK